MKYVCALIVVEDIAIAKDFYVRVLKQKIMADFGENVAFEGGFAIHKREHFQALIENRAIGRGGNDAELYFEHDDVEAVEQELVTEGVEFVHRTREQPWRQRVLRFYDRDRHIIEIGESMEYLAHRLWREGKTEEEISAMTMLGADFVKAAIARYAD
jgi:catechol 2,3-dioxygenase-like lactoylglutathione lyase family enzyme